jgi:cytoskeletal protein CcmA (bactofilin family)
MEVYGLESLEALTDGVTDDEKLPGHIVSNATTGQSDPNAIVLGTGTKVAGDVKARGPIDLSGGPVVQGEVLPNAAQQNLPDVDFAALDPAGKQYLEDWTVGEKELVGRSRYTGNLTIGDLEMSEGMLYVDGDVTVTGKVKGKGAIVATGKITVTGSMETEADHAALVAKGDIKIHGDGPNSSKFYGLVYSEGSIDIARTTIMGAAVSKDTAGTTKLEDVVAVAVPELTVMDLETHTTLSEAMEMNFGTVLAIRDSSSGTITRLSPGLGTPHSLDRRSAVYHSIG